LWDEKEKEISIRQVDPYDLYIDKNARNEHEARRMTLCVRRNIKDLLADDKYDKEEVEKMKSGDKRLAASEMKERLIKLDKGDDVDSRQKADDTVIVKEIWYYDKEDKEDSESIYIAALANERLIRKPEKTDHTKLPFFKYEAVSEPLKLYSDGWVKDMIPVNKILNSAVSSVVEYNEIMNRVKTLEDKGANVHTINAEHGQRIIKKRGYDVTQLPPAPLNVAVFKQIEYANLTLEDLGGAHDASMGRVPTGAKSGKALEALQVGDANNMSEAIENLEDFLSDVYEYVLEIAARKYQFVRNVSPINSLDERDFIKVIGEMAKNKPDDAVAIRTKNMVRVKIATHLAYTPQARKEAMIELLQVMPDIDPQTVLEAFEIGNIGDILLRMKKRQEDQNTREDQKMLMNNELQKDMAAQGQQQPQGSGPEQAIAAIRNILQGQNPEIPDVVTPEFIQYLDQFIQREQTSPSEDMEPQMLEIIQAYRDKVVEVAQQAR
jgi:tetrahydromethanopterin S-methyltransferase subunit G